MVVFTGGRERTPGSGFPVVTTVRDALYDRIPLSVPELAILGARAFLRLEGIEQLGFISRIWPGARHSRYEHSLGVLHLARLAVDRLRGRAEGGWISETDARTLLAAALLHDIGHYPFSHAIEELGRPVLPHEQVGRRIITGPEIAPILEAAWGVDPERVASIVDPHGHDLPQSDRILRGILSGPLDVDKLDYLPRDARACSVPYGGVDAARLIDSLGIAEITEPDAVWPTRRIVIGAKGVSPVHSLINARQEMFDNVYWHHTNRGCMAMLLRAVQEALAAGAMTAETLTTLDDASLMAMLGGPAMPEVTQTLTAALAERRVHKRAVEIGSRATELYGRLGNLFFDPAARLDAENRMARRLSSLTGVPTPDGAILIDIPKPEKWRTDVWVRFERPPIGFDPVMPWKDVVGLDDDDFKRYEEHRRLIRIVAAAPFRGEVAARWESLVTPLLGESI